MATITVPGLRKAVKEHFEWQGDRCGHAVKIVQNIKSGYKMVLVRFTDAQGNKLSGFMTFQEWNDGHCDVTEAYVFRRECEDANIEVFRKSQDYV